MGKRPELGTIEVGQKVMIVRSPNDMRARAPEDRYIPAYVIKASRIWIELSRDLDSPTWSVYRWRMRKDTQDDASQYSGSSQRFITLKQYEWEKAQAWALEVINEHGLRVDRNSRWYGEEQELASLLTPEHWD